MRNSQIKVGLLMLVVCFCSTLLPVHCVAEVVMLDAVLASIDGDPLTLAELRRHMAAQGFEKSYDLEPDSPGLRQYLQDLVFYKLLNKEAEAIGISVSEEEVKAYIEEIKRQNSVDDKGFEELLSNRGVSREDYITQIKNDILKSRVVSARVRSKVNVLDEDVERFLNEHPELRPELGSVRLQQISIPFEAQSAESNNAVRQKLAEIRAKILSGESQILELFRKEGGSFFKDLGHVKVADLRKQLQDAVEGLTVGGLSEPVEIGATLNLFFLASKATATAPVDAVLRDEIKSQIFKQKFEQLLKAYIDHELPKRYHVELKL